MSLNKQIPNFETLKILEIQECEILVTFLFDRLSKILLQNLSSPHLLGFHKTIFKRVVDFSK